MLGIPVPNVLAWDSRASETGNPVGAEYIFMEKATGSCLSAVWPRLTNHEKRDLVQAVVSIEVKMLNHPLGGIGSLFYPKDVPPGTKSIPALGPKETCSRWVLGPTTDRRFFDDGKGELLLDRGPCKFLLLPRIKPRQLNIGRREHDTRVCKGRLPSGDGRHLGPETNPQTRRNRRPRWIST